MSDDELDGMPIPDEFQACERGVESEINDRSLVDNATRDYLSRRKPQKMILDHLRRSEQAQ